MAKSMDDADQSFPVIVDTGMFFAYITSQQNSTRARETLHQGQRSEHSS